MSSVTIVGVGKVGGALAIALNNAGYTVENLVHRDARIAKRIKTKEIRDVTLHNWRSTPELDTEIIIITVPDPEIASVADSITRVSRKGQVVIHTSGSLNSTVLSKLKDAGCNIGSFHPLVSISNPFRGALGFKGVYFCVEGDRRSVATAKQLATALKGKPFTIPASKKALYHAAAVTSAGHTTALFDVSVEMLMKCGIKRDLARKVLFPLISSTVANLKEQDTTDALTGSFARLDLSAFERHLLSFRGVLPREIQELYLSLGARSLDIVRRRDGRAPEIRDLQNRILMAKRNIR